MRHQSDDSAGGGWKAWLWMAACCIPIILVIGYAFWSSRSP